MIQRLDFSLPRFTRVGWVSDRARSVWGPRIKAISLASQRFEWQSVVEGMRDTALLFIDADRLVEIATPLAREGLHALPMEVKRDDGTLIVAVGRPEQALRLWSAYGDRDDETVGDLLGYPACCRAAFAKRWNSEGIVDLIWQMASATPDAEREASNRWALVPRVPNNVLLGRVGVRVVFHLPCHFACEESERLGRQHLEWLDGLADPVGDWARQMLSWPMEWSVLHGIAEVKTPVLRLIANSDATASKHVVRLYGIGHPDEAAQGTAFPFQPRRKHNGRLPVLQ